MSFLRGRKKKKKKKKFFFFVLVPTSSLTVKLLPEIEKKPLDDIFVLFNIKLWVTRPCRHNYFLKKKKKKKKKKTFLGTFSNSFWGKCILILQLFPIWNKDLQYTQNGITDLIFDQIFFYLCFIECQIYFWHK